MSQLELSISRINEISKKDFQMMKSFASPPPGVAMVMSSCLMLLEGKIPKSK